jgi:hypothetical protein
LHTTELPFITEIRRTKGNIETEIALIHAGIVRPRRDGRDITQEALADLSRRRADCQAILAASI